MFTTKNGSYTSVSVCLCVRWCVREGTRACAHA